MVYQSETLNMGRAKSAGMSTPPPGGPQAPQQPYPQAPPPQYPPQQPYYPQQVTPPPKKSNTALIVVLIVVVVVVVIGVLAWYAVTVMFRPVTNSQISVTGVSFTIIYPGSTQYFGASPHTSCTSCPIAVTFPYQFTYVLSLTNSDSVAHNVTGVTVSGITFNLVSASPSPSTSSPVVVNPSATRAITLTIQASPFAGSYTLTGTVDTD